MNRTSQPQENSSLRKCGVQSITIKQEMNLDDIYEMECNEDYSVTTADISKFLPGSSGIQDSSSMIEIKTEPIENSDSEATEDALEDCYNRPEAIKQEDLGTDESQGENTEPFGTTSGPDGALMHLGKTEDFNRLILTEAGMFCHYTGFPSVRIFTELLDYMNDEILELDDIPKYCQLLAVLAKLHLNIDSFCIHPYKFPGIYVLLINALYNQLSFMWKLKIHNWGTPKSLKKYVPRNGDGAIVGLLKVAFQSSKHTRSTFVQYIIGYTCHGQVFFASRYFKQRMHIVNMLINCGILKKMTKANWYIYSDANRLMRCKSTHFQPIAMKPNAAAQERIHDVMNTISEKFLVFKSKFPEYMLRSLGGLCFLDKLVNVCCILHNMSQ